MVNNHLNGVDDSLHCSGVEVLQQLAESQCEDLK